MLRLRPTLLAVALVGALALPHWGRAAELLYVRGTGEAILDARDETDAVWIFTLSMSSGFPILRPNAYEAPFGDQDQIIAEFDFLADFDVSRRGAPAGFRWGRSFPPGSIRSTTWIARSTAPPLRRWATRRNDHCNSAWSARETMTPITTSMLRIC